MTSTILLRGTVSRLIGNQLCRRSFSTAVRVFIPSTNQFRGRSFSTAVNQSRLIVPITNSSFLRKFSSQSVEVSNKIHSDDVKKLSLEESIQSLYSKLESMKLELESIRGAELVIGKDESTQNEEISVKDESEELLKAGDVTYQGLTDNESHSFSETEDESDNESHSFSETEDESDRDVESEGEPKEIKGESQSEPIYPSTFIKGIESEINSAVSFNLDADEGTKIPPEGYPFKLLEDRPGTPSILLSREYGGEHIEVRVENPTVYLHNYYNDPEDTKKFETLKDTSFNMDLSVKVSCAITRTPKVEFKGTAYKDRFCIYRARYPADGSENEGVHFSDLDKHLQSEFHKYLETRGFKPCNTNYIYQYMLGKANREKLRLLQKFRNLV